MLELISLRWKGAGRFVEEQSIKFDSLPQLTQVDGFNKNTGGSSGSGKSTVFKALDYNLGLGNTPATKLRSRYSKEMWTESVWSLDGQEIVIKRSTSSGLQITGTDQYGVPFSVTDNVALAEEKIDELLVLPRDLVRLMTHKRQGEGGFFLNLTPGQMFKFLVKIKKLESKQKALDLELAKKGDADKEIERLTTQLEERARIVETATAHLHSLTPPVAVRPTVSLDALKVELQTAQKQLADLDKAMAQDLLAIPRPAHASFVAPQKLLETADTLKAQLEIERDRIAAETSATADRQMKIKDAINKLEQRIYGLKEKKARIVSLATEVRSVETHIQHQEGGHCPTCEQAWTTDSAQQALAKAKEKLDALRQNIASLTEEIDAANEPDLVAKVAKAKEILSTLKVTSAKSEAMVAIESQLLQNQKDINDAMRQHSEKQSVLTAEYLSARQAVEAQYLASKKPVQERMDRIEAEIQDVSGLVAKNLSDQRFYEAMLVEANKSLAAAVKNHQELAEKQRQARQVSALAEESHRALKSFILTVFDECLEKIGDKATEILQRLPNMATAAVYFESFKEVTSGPNKGKIKEEIVAILSMDGETNVSVDTISGGERASLDLAIDLAVIDFVEEEGGIGTNYFILDEPCGGMDDICKEQYVEILKNSGSKKKIVIVEHSKEIKEIVEDTVLIVRDGLTSKVGQ